MVPPKVALQPWAHYTGVTTPPNIGITRPAGYLLPGAYEQRTPGLPQVAASGAVTIPCVVATGSRTRTYTDTAIVRGQVTNEALTLTLDSGSYIATLATAAGALRDTTRLSVARTLNGETVTLPRSGVTFRPAVVTGSVTGTLDLGATTGGVAFGLVSDGSPAGVTFLVRHVAGPVAPTAATATVTGRQVIVEATFSGTGGAAATITEISQAINAAFGAATVQALGFSGWAAAASVSGGALRITTPSTLTSRGLRIVAAAAGRTGTVTPLTSTSLFGAATLTAPTIVAIDASQYNALATYTCTYVANGDTSDDLVGTNPSIRRVGSFAGSADFSTGTDFSLSGNTLSWAGLTAAIVQSSTSGNMNLATNDTIAVGVDAQSILGIDLIQSGTLSVRVISGGIVTATVSSATVVGFDTGLTANAVTPAQAVSQINAILAWVYGPDYAAVASVVSSGVRLTSRVLGTAGSIAITIDPSSAGSAAAITTIFGAANPAGTTAIGTGRAPSLGSVYYVTYDAVRPSREYNVPVLLTDAGQVADRFGAAETAIPGLNPLAQALDFALKTVGVPAVYAIQIDDATVAGQPTAPEIEAALNASLTPSDLGGIVLFGNQIGTTATSISAQLNHLARARNQEVRRYRRLYVAPPTSAPLGSPDTPGSARFLSARTLQVAADSEARGAILCAYWATTSASGSGTGIRRQVSIDNGTATATISCGHEWLALWMCLTRETIPVAATLGGRSVPGFDLTDARPIDQSLLKFAIGSGLCAASIDTGVPVIVEGVSTEQGGSADARYAIDSNTTQSDALSRRTRAAIESLRYIVPETPTDIEAACRRALAQAIRAGITAGEVATYTDAAGAAREVDETSDVTVVLNSNDTREVFYAYQFVLRAPFLRGFGKSTAVLR